MTNREAIQILENSNELLSAQIRRLQGASRAVSPEGVYDTLDYCKAEYEAVRMAIRALEMQCLSERKVKRVSRYYALRIIDTREPKGLFYVIEDGYYIGIDNSTGHANTEAFKTREGCVEWLRDSYKEA